MTRAPSPMPHNPMPQKPPTAPVLSPHLQIWRFTVSMAASITHRATGLALYAGSALLAIWLYATAASPALYSVLGGLIASPLGIGVLAGYSWALCFHMINGLRHLFWDRGHGFDLPTVRTTAWATYIGATVLMLIIMFVGLNNAGAL